MLDVDWWNPDYFSTGMKQGEKYAG
jgi:hypothetical protein